MAATAASAVLPGGDARTQALDAVLRRRQEQPDALLEVLHDAQAIFGHLPREVLAHVASRLGLPRSRVFGVATFYGLFRLAPPGAHACTVCVGTACHLAGAGALLAEAAAAGGVEPGQTSADGQLSLSVAHCVGTCGIAPVAIFDEAPAGQLDRAMVRARLSAWRRGP